MTIKVEPLESRTYVLHTSQIKQVGASSQYEYEYDRSTINVLIRGLKEDLDQLTADQFGAENDGEVMFQAFYENSAYEVVYYDHPQITVREIGPGATDGGDETSGTDDGETAADETTAAD